MGPLVAFYILLYCCQQKHLPPASVYITANQKKKSIIHMIHLCLISRTPFEFTS